MSKIAMRAQVAKRYIKGEGIEIPFRPRGSFRRRPYERGAPGDNPTPQGIH